MVVGKYRGRHCKVRRRIHLPVPGNEGRISGGPPKQQEDNMLSLTGKTMVVIGGSRGVGRQIVEAGIRNGARVLAVARGEGRLARFAREVPGTETLSLDATDEAAP